MNDNNSFVSIFISNFTHYKMIAKCKSTNFNQILKIMNPKVSIIMGSTSDLPVMKKAAQVLNDFQIPFEINALSAHRTPDAVEKFSKEAQGRGVEVIIAAAGMAAHLAGVIASMTSIPVVAVPIKASLDGLDALLAMVQMPAGIPVATVAIDGAMNAGILAAQIVAVGDDNLKAKIRDFKETLKDKIVKANEELAEIKFEYKTN